MYEKTRKRQEKELCVDGTELTKWKVLNEVTDVPVKGKVQYTSKVNIRKFLHPRLQKLSS